MLDWHGDYMADLHGVHERIHLSDGDKAAAKKLIYEEHREPVLQEYSDEIQSNIPVALIGAISIIIIITAIIIGFAK